MPRPAPQPAPSGRPRRARVDPGTRALLIAGGGVVAAIVIGGLMLALANSGSVKTSLGDNEFRAGSAERLAASIDQDGPVLFPDASPTQSRDVYLQHRGDDETSGWSAFSAHAVDDESRSCVIEWDADAARFRDPCTAATFGADGAGLTQYAVRVEDGAVMIDLNE